MTRVEIQLFGALRECEPEGCLRLDVDAADIATLRRAVVAHALDCWPAPRSALVAHSAFATEASILRDAESVPRNGRLALLPPVSGG